MTRQQIIQSERKEGYFKEYMKDEFKKLEIEGDKKEAIMELLLYAYRRGRGEML